MKFNAVIDYSEPTSSNMLFTEKSLSEAFSESSFMEQCEKGEIPVYLELDNGERMLIGKAGAKLEYPNVSIHAEICGNEDIIKLFKKTVRTKTAGCALTTIGKKYYDVQKDCSVTGSIKCTGLKVVPNRSVPCLMEIVKEPVPTKETKVEKIEEKTE